jgi:hypothetical protein
LKNVVFVAVLVCVLGALTLVSQHYRRTIEQQRAAAETIQQAKLQEGAKRAAEEAARAEAAKRALCRANAEAISINYDTLFKQRRYLEAASVVRDCAETTGEPAFKRATDAAYIADYKATADNPKASFVNRILSLERLEKEYPEAYKGRERQHALMRKELDEREAKDQARDPIDCAVDKTTDAYFCYDVREVREVNGIRRAPLYKGGPNSIHRTTFSIAANCTTMLLHLKDSDGVSFAEASYEEGTKHSRQLLDLVCAAKLRASQKK